MIPRRDPTSLDLRVFGCGLAAIIGVFAFLHTSGPLAIVAAVFGSFGLVAPAVLRYPYRLWMFIVRPIAALVSFVVLASIYFLIVVPVGFARRAFGWRGLDARFDRDASTYWIARPAARADQTLRQY